MNLLENYQESHSTNYFDWLLIIPFTCLIVIFVIHNFYCCLAFFDLVENPRNSRNSSNNSRNSSNNSRNSRNSSNDFRESLKNSIPNSYLLTYKGWK